MMQESNNSGSKERDEEGGRGNPFVYPHLLSF